MRLYSDIYVNKLFFALIKNIQKRLINNELYHYLLYLFIDLDVYYVPIVSVL